MACNLYYNWFLNSWLPQSLCMSSNVRIAKHLSWCSSLCIWFQALESVDEALIRLEKLLKELHVSNSCSGKEHLKAACSDLERIRKLKKEAEFLEASFRAKAASLQQEQVCSNEYRVHRTCCPAFLLVKYIQFFIMFFGNW